MFDSATQGLGFSAPSILGPLFHNFQEVNKNVKLTGNSNVHPLISLALRLREIHHVNCQNKLGFQFTRRAGFMPQNLVPVTVPVKVNRSQW